MNCILEMHFINIDLENIGKITNLIQNPYGSKVVGQFWSCSKDRRYELNHGGVIKD